MSKKPKEPTKTTEFAIEGVEEAWEPAKPAARKRPQDFAPLEVEKPPELQGEHVPEAKIWILERRARGLLAVVKRWFVGKSRR